MWLHLILLFYVMILYMLPTIYSLYNEKYVSYFHLGTIGGNTAKSSLVHSFGNTYTRISLSPGVELLSHGFETSSTLLDNAKLFFKVIIKLYMPQT